MDINKLKQNVVHILENDPSQKYTVQELAKVMKLDSSLHYKFIVKAVAELEHEKKVKLIQDNLLELVEDKKLKKYVGIFHGNDRGFGFVSVDDEDIDDFFISPNLTLNALNGDVVEVLMLTEGNHEDVKPTGKVSKILNRAMTQVVGEFYLPKDEKLPKGILGYIKISDKKMLKYRFMVQNLGLHPVEGEVVLADITEYPTPESPDILKGVAVKIIGNVNDPGVDILKIVYQHNIPTSFPDEVMAQVETIPNEVTEEEKKGRKDLTNQKLVTIDSIESKDLDDAVTAWKLPNGNYHLGVHIADVSHYVTPKSPLDKEAFERGTSVYLTDRVIPMLPPKLSNGICSLNPKVNRLAMSCEMEITPEGEVVKHEIFPSVIKTTERMTYEAINKILESHDQKTMERYQDLVEMFQVMGQLHKVLFKMRKRRGAIEFDYPEAKIIVDSKGHPVDIKIRERGISERMVESFMLAANETVANHYNKLNVPFVYRIHENPKEDKVKSFFEMMSGFGVQVTGKIGNITPKMMQGVLKKVAGKPEEVTASTLMLRAMQQAKYSPNPIGHFGLAAKDYTHFTSPIRRYPDLMVHRLIRFYAENGLNDKYENKLDEITTHSSEMERRAIDAERDTDAMKKAEYMADHVGEDFDAVVSSVTKFGMFIALSNTVEGLIHISELKDDFYVFVEKQMALVGQKSKRTFRMGQPLKVKLVNVNVEQKEIDFKLLEGNDIPKTDFLDGMELPQQKKFSRNKKFEGNRKKDSRPRNKKPFYKKVQKNRGK